MHHLMDYRAVDTAYLIMIAYGCSPSRAFDYMLNNISPK